ncbi:hypothetical protein TNIN_31581 [Trichonephila inaurata madagascariensis]|uniref:Uncharacterized protein n=1 Tax=Trichonephila inaurata madagascariensis TaxID=2747483 RepID=A0A8X6WYD5_9ARAC|nr:hypothetical protein TNIN_31581 [Trichonephila inaurata madagascariensis]
MSSVLESELCHVSGVCLVSGCQNSVYRHWYVQWPGGRTLSSVRGMLVSEWQNSVQRQGYVLCPSGRFLSCVRGMQSVRVSELYRSSGVLFAELCPASKIYPGAWRQNSFQCQEYIHCFRDRNLSREGLSPMGLEAELCSSSEV